MLNPLFLLPKWIRRIPMWYFLTRGILNILLIILLILFLLFIVLRGSWGQNLNRLGIVLELIGITALIPEMIDAQRIVQWEEKFKNLGDQLSDEIQNMFLFVDFANIVTAVPFAQRNRGILGKIYRYSRVRAYILLCLLLIFLWSDAITRKGEALLIAIIISSLTAIWILSYLAFRALARKGNKLAIVPLIIFAPLYLIIESATLYFSMSTVSIALVYVKIAILQSRHSLKQVLLWWTTPLVATGMILEFISTYF